MDIIGLGFDATDIPRIADVLADTATGSSGGSSPRERSPIVRGGATRSRRWRRASPSKEACMKALGTGHSRGVLWKDIEVVP